MSARLTDPRDPRTGRYPFEWVRADDTDVAATFKKARREMLESKTAPRPVSVISERKRNERS